MRLSCKCTRKWRARWERCESGGKRACERGKRTHFFRRAGEQRVLEEELARGDNRSELRSARAKPLERDRVLAEVVDNEVQELHGTR